MSKRLIMEITLSFCLLAFVLTACHIDTPTDSTEELITDTDNADKEYSMLEDIEFDSTKGISYEEVIEICKKYIGEYMDVEGNDGYPYGFRCHEGTIVYENNEYFIVRIVTVGDYFVSYAGHAFVSVDGNEVYSGIKHSDGTYSFGDKLNTDPEILE